MSRRYSSPDELAADALAALRSGPQETANEHIARLVRMGLIDTKGRLTKIFGGDAEPEIDKADAMLNKDNGKPSGPTGAETEKAPWQKNEGQKNGKLHLPILSHFFAPDFFAIGSMPPRPLRRFRPQLFASPSPAR